jgi:hypothetical protein
VPGAVSTGHTVVFTVGGISGPTAKETTAELPQKMFKENIEFWTRVPSVAEMRECMNDRELRQMIGKKDREILRSILLSNGIHLIHLPQELKIKERADTTDQFLSIISSPEKELMFREKKEEHDVLYL